MDPKDNRTDRTAGETDTSKSRPARPMDRRAALARLGLAAGVAYLAPSLAVLKSASAHHKPNHGGGGGGNGGPSWSTPSKPTRGSPPSRPSKASKPSK